MIGSEHVAALPLVQLRAEEAACVVELVGAPDEVRRLAEMGLSVGATIRMIRPGAPCLLAVGDTGAKRLSLRLSGEVDILVAPRPTPIPQSGL
ncbi:MAG: hypothetical protein KatS3mg111_1779 [Pirellulaceae bacterium]|nr:MAG: hypothetical protein KatS3mg111_1779 [Pirellulaceae bacterium]